MTTIRSGERLSIRLNSSVRRILRGCRMGKPSAILFGAGGVNTWERPTGLSGCVTIPTRFTSGELASHCKVGSPISPLPMNTTRGLLLIEYNRRSHEFGSFGRKTQRIPACWSRSSAERQYSVACIPNHSKDILENLHRRLKGIDISHQAGIEIQYWLGLFLKSG